MSRWFEGVQGVTMEGHGVYIQSLVGLDIGFPLYATFFVVDTAASGLGVGGLALTFL